MTDGRITLYVAASLDGFVAAADGDVSWLDAYHDDESTADYGAFFADVDCLVMGSRTYEQVLGFGEWPYERRPTYVVTGRDLPRANDAVEFADRPVPELAADLRSRYDHVWLVGGAQLAQAFLREDLVDELRLHVVPTFVGRGVRLFGHPGPSRAPTLVGTTTYDSGVVELRYDLG
jgi:dihydrofolate reductase